MEASIGLVTDPSHRLPTNLIRLDRRGDHALGRHRKRFIGQEPHLRRANHDGGEIILLRCIEADVAEVRGKPYGAAKLRQTRRLFMTPFQHKVGHQARRDHFTMQIIRVQPWQNGQTLRDRVRRRDPRALKTDSTEQRIRLNDMIQRLRDLAPSHRFDRRDAVGVERVGA